VECASKQVGHANDIADVTTVSSSQAVSLIILEVRAMLACQNFSINYMTFNLLQMPLHIYRGLVNIN